MNQERIKSIKRDIERIGIIKKVLDSLENKSFVALDSVRYKDVCFDMANVIFELEKEQLGLLPLESRIKDFLNENNLDWSISFNKSFSCLNVMTNHGEIMHEGLMSKFSKLFDFDIEEHEDDDTKSRFSYQVTDFKNE